MVAEDAKSVRSQCTSRHVEYARQQLAGNLIHIGNHQQQALRSSVSCCQGTGLKRTVNSTGGSTFRLHFLHQNGFTEDVFTSCGSPFINILSHCRRRSDRINGRNFRKHVAHVSGSLITITGQEFLFFTHNLVIYFMENMNIKLLNRVNGMMQRSVFPFQLTNLMINRLTAKTIPLSLRNFVS